MACQQAQRPEQLVGMVSISHLIPTPDFLRQSFFKAQKQILELEIFQDEIQRMDLDPFFELELYLSNSMNVCSVRTLSTRHPIHWP